MPPLRGAAGSVKNRVAGERSTSRPSYRNRISSPRRRACPRLCVHITIFVPAVVDRLDDPLHFGARARIEAGGGLVEEQHLRSQRPRAGEREPLLFAARQDARGTFRQIREADALERRACLLPALGAGNAGEAERVLDVRDRRSAQHHRALEHHRLAPPLARALRHGPLDAPGGRRKQPVAEPHEHALPGPVRPEDDRARPGLEHERDTVDDRPLADDERHVVEPQRQDGCRRAHRFLTHSAAAQLP